MTIKYRRLQGFTDERFYTVEALGTSDTQLCKQAATPSDPKGDDTKAENSVTYLYYSDISVWMEIGNDGGCTGDCSELNLMGSVSRVCNAVSVSCY